MVIAGTSIGRDNPPAPSIPDKSRRPKKPLTLRQQTAIAALAAGKTDEEAGGIAHVTRQTVNEWRNHDVRFIAALGEARNKAAKEMTQVYSKNTRALLNAALVSLAKNLKREDVRATMWLLDKISFGEFAGQIFASMVDPTPMPDTTSAVIDEMAAKRVDEFLASKGVGPLERLRIREALVAKETAALNAENDHDEKG